LNLEKQKLLLEYLIANGNLWNKCQHIIKPDYWDVELRPALEFAIDYNINYKALPDRVKITAETGVDLEPQVISGDTFDYACDEIETYCRNRAVEFAIRKGPKLLEEQDFGTLIETLKEAIMIKLDRNIGLDYFDDVEGRLRRMLENDKPISTGWPTVDNVLGGGITRREMLLFLGTSGVGKSIVMLNQAKNLLEQGFNGVYYTLEMSEDVVAQRLDMMISGIGFNKVLSQIDYVAGAIALQKPKMGNMLIKYFPASTTTALDLSANIKEIELETGWVPDFIIIDYLDLMAPINRTAGKDNLFIREKYIAEEVRNLGGDFDAMIITASQMNRSAVNAENHDHSMVSGGISKINTAGWVISLARNQIMKSSGEMMWQFLKTRSSAGVGKRQYMDISEIDQVITDSSRKNPNDTSDAGETPMDKLNEKIITELAKNNTDTVGKLKGLGLFDEEEEL